MGSQKRREATAEKWRSWGIDVRVVSGGYEIMVQGERKYLHWDETHAFSWGLVVGGQVEGISLLASTESRNDG